MDEGMLSWLSKKRERKRETLLQRSQTKLSSVASIFSEERENRKRSLIKEWGKREREGEKGCFWAMLKKRRLLSLSSLLLRA